MFVRIYVSLGGKCMFNFFKKKDKGNLDISNVSNDNVNDYLKSGQLKLIYLISPDFGGSEGRENQVVVTPKAEEEKKAIDAELYDLLAQGKSVGMKMDLKYKEKSIVPSQIIFLITIDGKECNKVIEVW